MRHSLFVAMVLPLCGGSLAYGADTGLRVIVASELAPGVYGRVELGNAPPPPVLYAKPVIIAAPPSGQPARPMYLHVPPGHAKNWSKHCHRYSACGQPVYFVKSEEYEPKKAKKEKKEK